MWLYFDIDTAHCFRKGINVDHELAAIEVDPRNLSEADRALIADHLQGTDVRPRVPVIERDENGVDQFIGQFEFPDVRIKA